ncbi:PREDICTED: leucine-rich repeat-containing protein 74B-like [Dinoponera quadriceps]|uniref:Leucine-rich repeat-containing protein 74B-like n=1 Tax=Dinoponera quadriceps TaxID=609295 RepID=A0A6P3XML0_DINQU|nr:PREDICTED: leucine-rich repeat-containing protein 74B-like [Dinoponera quadriceps]
MDLPQTPEDIEDVVDAFDYSYADVWGDYDDYGIYMGEEEREEEEVTEVDVTEQITKVEVEKIDELVAKVEEEEEKPRRLILTPVRRKVVTTESEETLVTPEEEVSVTSYETTTESSVHPCLRDIDISDSKLKLVDPYTVYPIPPDPGLIPAFWVLYDRPPTYHDDFGRKYYDATKRTGVRPIESLRHMLVTDEVNLCYCGLESRAMKAICEGLSGNTFVRKVDLKDNRLSEEACGHLNKMLLENNAITSLSLSACRIGANGARKLYNAISTSTTLKSLDLSDCDIGNEGFEHVASALSDSPALESVNLSGNRLDESCAENLRDMLLRNVQLKDLDLSWNSLYSAETWKALVNGLTKNETLLSLNLSWNGLQSECVRYLCQLLLQSRNIEKLNLNRNNLTEEDAVHIASALAKNNTLQKLYLSNNPLKAQGALVLVQAMKPRDVVLRLLDLENVWAKKDILPELERIKVLKPGVVVRLGGILSNYKLVGPNERKILLKRAKHEAMMPKRKKQQRDFGQFVISLQDSDIFRQRFKSLIRKFRLKLSETLVEELMRVFEGKKKNTVDQQLLKSCYLEEYPETILSMLKKKGIK